MSPTPITSAPTDDQSPERVFEATAYWMGIVGRTSIFLAFVVVTINALRFNFFSIAIGVVAGALSLLIGILTLNAAAAFRKVAQMDDQAPTHLRQAGLSLRNLFRLHTVVIVLQSAVVLLAAIVNWLA